MKKFNFIIALFIGLFFIHPNANAQSKLVQFTSDPVKFLSELHDFFESGNGNKKEIKTYMEQFTISWNAPKFTDKYKQAAYDVCNLMLKKRMRPFPDFKNYLDALNNFVNSGQSDKNFEVWQATLHSMLTGRTIKNYTDFVVMSANLFGSNTFYTSPTYKWSSSTSNYQMVYENEVPKIIFPSANLRCLNERSDSTFIYNTKGVFYPLTNKWDGYGGKVDWSRDSLDANTIFAQLNTYHIILKTGGYTADSVIFYQKKYFDKPLIGVLNDKDVAEAKGVNSFPRFDSYNKRFSIKNIAPNVDYDGGFSMRGGKFIGSGSATENAYLYFKRNDSIFIVASAKSFDIRKDRILCPETAIKMILDTDSIYHPNLEMRYIIATKHLTFIRTDEGVSKTPYSDTYHNVDMYFEYLSWKTDEPKIDMEMLPGNSQGVADFASTNYFKRDLYDNIQGQANVSPLITIAGYSKSLGGSRDFLGDNLAGFMGHTADDIHPLLIQLASMGFLTFNTGNDQIHLKEKLFKYITDNAGRTDYDVLDFHSVNRGQINASMNLLNYDITIHGVAGILLSDSQNVYIFPKDSEVVLKKNRNFTFAGIVHAGRFDFFGKVFSFEYNDFKINLTNVDSLRLKAESFDADPYGQHRLVPVKTVIQNINGELFIDNPANKSGVKDFAKYPIFKSNKDAYVYYDKRSIQKGAYKKDKFYFHLKPFTIDSLDNFTNASLHFQGDFVSAGIFPQFAEQLTLQKDYSLGFIRSTPPDGFAVYGGKGVFKNQIKLSNQGLRGDGTVDYVTSTTTSNNFIFYPDSTNTIAQNFDIKEQKTNPQFPQVHGQHVRIHWVPILDVMDASNKKDSVFQCFNGQSTFSGKFSLTPKVLTGNGKADFSGAELTAVKTNFLQHEMLSDTADFQLKALDTANLAFTTTNVNAHINFDERKGDFKSNGKGSIVKFPVNQYMCFMDKFNWLMDKNSIELSSDKNKASANVAAASGASPNSDIDLAGSEFISIHPKQDSLRFKAPSAKYDLKKYVITAKEVKYIRVADALIYPNNGLVIIRKKAYMETLDSAKILANTTTRYHHLYNATVNVFSRKKYAGSGFYDYIDELKKKESIYFSNISVDTTLQTYAETTIPDSVHFTLSPNYDYKGKVKLAANNQFLVFSGTTRIQHGCDAVSKTWFAFTSEINPEQIYIPVSDTLYDDKGNKIAASIMYTKDSTRIYSAFLSKIVGRQDIQLLPATGFLFYDKASTEYRISNKEKLVERNLTGNYLSLNVNKCIVYGEGKINVGTDYGQVQMNTVGNITHYLIPDSTAFHLMFSLDFFFDENAIQKMGEAINNYAGLNSIDFSKPEYEKGLRELLGKDKADKLISQVNLYGSFKKFPDELKKSMFFTDVQMKWNPQTRSFISSGKIGIGNFNKTQINKYVNGHIEFKKNRAGDELNIYIELDGNNWYYFNYARGTMQAISSDANFNNAISSLKPDKREQKGDKAQGGTYYFNLSTLNKKSAFLRHISNSGE
ncbi:MAG: hypothetical protein ABI199_09275 [Bacteroidia bacterium]